MNDFFFRMQLHFCGDLQLHVQAKLQSQPQLNFSFSRGQQQVQLITLDRPASLDSLLEMPNLLGYA
jgi:hypothetical protein